MDGRWIVPLTIQKRLAIWRILISALRKGHSSNLPGRPLGPDIPLMMVFGTVVILSSEGNPTNVSKVAAYLELPRETTRRHLDQLVRLGLLKRDHRQYRLTQNVVSKHIDALGAFIRGAAAKL
jgi:DNA-binding transcriptional ArsR family regulator